METTVRLLSWRMQSLPRWVLAALALAAAAVHGLTAEAAPRSFKLVTYNVAGLPEGISRSRPLANLPRIGQLLNAYDIALVQEDFAYPLELRRLIRRLHGSEPFVRRDRLDFGDGLSHFAKWPFSAFQRHAWSSCNGVIDSFFDCLTPKGFTLARQLLGNDASVHVYNLHMDAGWSPEDAAARRGQVDQLVRAIRTHSSDAPVIVGGDTNIMPGERDLLERLQEEAGLRDACAEARCPEPWRIDRVLYRSSAEVRLRARRWRIAREFVDDKGRPLSDHLPVVVDFEWERVPSRT